MNFIEQDKKNLNIMQREKLMQDITKDICKANDDIKGYNFHVSESEKINERIKSFAKSPYKFLSPKELESKLDKDEITILNDIYKGIMELIEKQDYSPASKNNLQIVANVLENKFYNKGLK